MTATPNDDARNPDTEARLRAALTSRADAVEPGPGADVATVERMAAARAAAGRRRFVLSAAAVVAVVAGLAGAFVLVGDDDPDTEVAAGGTTTTVPSTTTAPALPPPPERPSIWPLPSMSIQYPTALDAAQAFISGYVGSTAECQSFEVEVETDVEVGFVGTDVVCGTPCPENANCVEDPLSATVVHAQQEGPGWVVTGADTEEFSVTTPAAQATVGADIEVAVDGVDPATTLTARVPPLGAEPASSPSVDTSTIPLAPEGSWRLVLGAADGPTVLVITDGVAATVRVFTVDSGAVVPETTTTTTGPTDDGTLGWPGAVARSFETPEAAAQVFVDEVLGFPDPALAGQVVEGTEAEFRYNPRPTASIETTIVLHDTGTARGWVVTGVTSTSGVIETVERTGDDITVTGSASAFEATVNVHVLDLQAIVLGETTTMAGGSGVLEPFTTVVRQDVAATGPVFIQIAESDASGEGDLTWAAWALVP